MPKDMSADTRIEAVAGKAVELPNGNFVANAEMTRSGMDLHLTGPDGHTIIVEGYFAQMPAPDLFTHDGARLTPAMVNAFVPPEHAGQYAASGQIANDASPAGKITQVVGDAHIIHADGTKILATVGALIFQGDVIETSKTGAVNIQFADNTTFAISESARMSVDQFVYHSADHTGSTFFSMLQGVFVYTSGLIGKSDPGSVNIETPVGSIGIRGTVVAGHIMPAGHDSQITIVDGAVTLTNGSGTQEMNTSLATVSLNSYQSQPQTIHMDANTFNNSYHSVSSVASETLGHFTGMTAPAGEHAPTGTAPAATGSGAATAPATTAPAATHAPAAAPAAPAPAPTGSAAPAPSSTDSTAQTAANTETAPVATTTAPTVTATTAPAPAAENTTAPATTTAAAAPAPTVTDAPAAPPPPPPLSSTSSFSSGSTSGSTFSGTSTATTFTPPPTTSSNASSDSTGTATTTTTAPPPPTTTTAPPPPPPLAVGLSNDTGVNNHTSNDSLMVSGIAPGVTVQYKIDAGAWNSITPTTATATITPPALPDGIHIVTVQEVDANGNVIATAAPLAFTLDTTAAAPIVALAVDSGVSNTDGITRFAALNVTNTETGAKIEYSTDGGTTWLGHAPSTDGVYTVITRETDLAGNISAPSAPITYTLDTTAAAPTIALASDTGVSSTDRITSIGILNVAGTEAGATIHYSTDGGATWTGSAPTADGTYTVITREIDLAGNISAPSASITYTLDTTAAGAPTVTFNDTGRFNNDGITNNGTLNVTGLALNTLVQYSTNGGTTWSASMLPAALPTTWAQGSDNIQIRQIDQAGNASTAASVTFTYDTAAPIAPSVALTSDTGVSSTDGITKIVNLSYGGMEGGALPYYSTNGGATWSTSVPAWTQGTNTLEIKQMDLAGNFSTASAPLTFTYDTTAPTLTVTSDTTQGKSAIAVGAEMTAVLTFSEALGTTPGVGSFNNFIASGSGGASVTVDSVTLSGTNQYTVMYHATTTGSLQMEAVALTDVAGNPLANPVQGTPVMVGQMASSLLSNTFVSSGLVAEFAPKGTQILQMTPVLSNPGDAISYTVTVTSATNPETLPGAVTQSIIGSTSVFGVNSSGQLIVLDPLALSYAKETSGIGITITATDTTTGLSAGTQNMLINLQNNGYAGEIDQNGGTFTGSTAAQFIVGYGSSSTLIGGGGADVILGSNVNDLIIVADGTFRYIDGGLGNNTLDLSTQGSTLTSPFGVNFTNPALAGAVNNIQFLELGQSGVSIPGGFQGNTANLDIKSVLSMTDSSHQLAVMAGSNVVQSALHIAPATGLNFGAGDQDLHLAGGDIWGVSQILHYTGSIGGNAVQLNVQEFANPTDTLASAGSVIVMDQTHPLMPTYTPNTTVITGNTGSDFIIGTSGGPQTLDGGGGQDILIGNNAGNGNTLVVESNNFVFLDGGRETASANNLLQLGASGPLSPFLNIDFTTMPQPNVRNIDFINLWTSGAGSTGNSVKLNIQDVFDMTNAADNHTLTISDTATNSAGAAIATVVANNTTSGYGSFGNGVTGGGNETFTGTYTDINGAHAVTLVIVSPNAGSSGSGVHVATALV